MTSACGLMVKFVYPVLQVWLSYQSRLTAYTVPLFCIGGPVFQSPVVQASESDLLLHATTMIETLRRARDFECKAHAQTRDSAEARIVSLEAQLSRREVELESFLSGTAHTVSTIRHEHPRDTDQLVDAPLTSEQVFSATVARNKTLDIEIDCLFKRVRISMWTLPSKFIFWYIYPASLRTLVWLHRHLIWMGRHRLLQVVFNSGVKSNSHWNTSQPLFRKILPFRRLNLHPFSEFSANQQPASTRNQTM